MTKLKAYDLSNMIDHCNKDKIPFVKISINPNKIFILFSAIYSRHYFPLFIYPILTTSKITEQVFSTWHWQIIRHINKSFYKELRWVSLPTFRIHIISQPVVYWTYSFATSLISCRNSIFFYRWLYFVLFVHSVYRF